MASTDNITPFDAIIPYHSKDAPIIPFCVETLRRNTRGLRNIYVISAEEPEDVEGIIWVSETAFPFSFENVKQYIHSTNNRHGWYYQQLLKFYAYKVIPEILPTILTIDSDVVIMRPIEFFKDGKILIDYGGLYVPEYFEHMRKLLPNIFENTLKESGVTDCMVFVKDVLDDLFERVEKEHSCALWKAMLTCVDPGNYNKSGMSEFEIYFQFVLLYYPQLYERRLLQKGYGTTMNNLRRTDVDFLSFHAWLRSDSE